MINPFTFLNQSGPITALPLWWLISWIVIIEILFINFLTAEKKLKKSKQMVWYGIKLISILLGTVLFIFLSFFFDVLFALILNINLVLPVLEWIGGIVIFFLVNYLIYKLIGGKRK